MGKLISLRPERLPAYLGIGIHIGGGENKRPVAVSIHMEDRATMRKPGKYQITFRGHVATRGEPSEWMKKLAVWWEEEIKQRGGRWAAHYSITGSGLYLLEDMAKVRLQTGSRERGPTFLERTYKGKRIIMPYDPEESLENEAGATVLVRDVELLRNWFRRWRPSWVNTLSCSNLRGQVRETELTQAEGGVRRLIRLLSGQQVDWVPAAAMALRAASWVRPLSREEEPKQLVVTPSGLTRPELDDWARLSPSMAVHKGMGLR